MANGTEVGKIYLGIHANSKPLEKQMASMQGKMQSAMADVGTKLGDAISGGLVTALKAGGIAAIVLALAKVGKECVELGSDLTEVQNVVDSTFTGMSQSVNEWAANASKQFGLSEKMAKEFAGYYGAMAKSAGIGGQELVSMSTNLAGLAGDVASFYNLSQEEAYSKLKGVFTGETEGLKGIGVTMTQTALDAFALANGFGKTTKEMSESEKVALRYTYVMDALSDASGDWQKTLGDSWSNQVKYLKLQLEQLGAVLGQLIIPLLLPVIKFLNKILELILKLANAIRRFFGMEEISCVTRGVDLTGTFSDMGDSAADAAENIDDVGDAATGAAQQIKRSLMGFDEIKKLMDSTASGASGAGSALADAVSNTVTIPDIVDVDDTPITEAVENAVIDWEKLFENMKTTGGTLTVDFRTVKISDAVRTAVQDALDTRMKEAPFTAEAIAQIGVGADLRIPEDLRKQVQDALYDLFKNKFTVTAQVEIKYKAILPKDDPENGQAYDDSGFSHSSGDYDTDYHSFFGEGYWLKLFGLSEWKEDNAGWISQHPTLAWLMGLGPYPGTTSPVVDVVAELTDTNDKIPLGKKIVDKVTAILTGNDDKIALKDKALDKYTAKLETAADEIRNKNIPFSAKLNNWFQDTSVWKGENWTSIGFAAKLNNWFQASNWKGESWTSIPFAAKLNNWFRDFTVWKGEDMTSIPFSAMLNNWFKASVWKGESWTSIGFAARLNDWFKDTSVWKGESWTSIPFAAKLNDWFKDTTVWKSSWNSIPFTAKLTDVDTSQLGSVITIGGQSFIARASGGVFSGGAWHDIPQYAGGTTNAGSLFIAGESGPEIVGHVGGRTEVLNRSQLAASVAAGVSRAMSGVRHLQDAATPKLAILGQSVSRSEGHLAAIEQHTAPSASGSAQQVELLKQILAAVLGIDPNVYLDGESVKNRVVSLVNQRTRATGVCEILV